MTADSSRGPFAVDNSRALEALAFVWGDEYDEIWRHFDQWCARHKDGHGENIVTGNTPDELNLAIRADWLRRETAVNQSQETGERGGGRELI
jgi:hypothetical protein